MTRGERTRSLLIAAALCLPATVQAQDVVVPIGDLPAGKMVTVLFDAQIDNPLSGPLVSTVQNQGQVTGTGFGPLPTDDPDDPTSGVDPTVTPLDGLTLGNRVWKNLDMNLVFDSGTDAGIDTVVVNLYVDDGDGVLDAGDGAAIATTTTAGGGLYTFTGLQPGDYLVQLDPCNFTGVGCGGVLATVASIAPVPAADPDDDVDHDDNGDAIMGLGVAAKAVTLAFNGETLGDEDGDGDTDTNLTVDFGFADLADLEVVSKADAPDPVDAGANLTYTIQFRNNGPSAALAAKVADTLPANTVLVSAAVTAGSGWSISAPAVGTTGTVEFTKASVAGAETATFEIVVQVDPALAAASMISNTATATSTTVDEVPGNNAKTSTTMVTTAADLTLTAKTDAPDPVTAGEQITYTIDYENLGPSNASGVEVTDTLPAGTTFVSLSKPATWGSVTPSVGSGGTVTLQRTTSPAGEMVSFTLVVEVDPSVADASTIDNTASVSATTPDPGPGANSAMASTTVQAVADLSLTKTDDVDPVAAGGTVVYTLTASNAGPSDAVTVQVADTLPAGMTFASTSGCANDPNGYPNCELGTVAAGGMKAYTLTATVDSPVAAGVDSLTNNATVSSATAESDGSNQDASESTAVTAAPDLTIAKSDGDASGFPSAVIVYTLDFDNVGSQGATGVEITETVPPDTTFDEAASGGAGVWSCADGAPAGTTCTHTVGALAATPPGPRFIVGSGGGPRPITHGRRRGTPPIALAGGGSVVFAVEVDASVELGTVREITNTATIADDAANGADGDPGDNSATDTTPLPVDFGDAPDPLDATAGLYPTLVANNGARHAINGGLFLGAAVDDEADGQPSPPLTPAADGDDTDIDGDDDDGVVLLDAFAVGATTNLEVTASAPGLLNAWVDFDVDGVFAPGEQVFTDTALVAGVNALAFATPAGALTGPTADLLQGTFARFRFDSGGGLGPTGQAIDGEVEDYFFTLETDADLAVTAAPSNDTPEGGSVLLVDLEVTNNGPVPATDVMVTIALPAGDFLGSESATAVCASSGVSTVDCDLGSMLKDDVDTLTVAVRLDPRVSGPFAGSATASANEPDPAAGNDSAAIGLTIAAAQTIAAVEFPDGGGTARRVAVLDKEADESMIVSIRDPDDGSSDGFGVAGFGYRGVDMQPLDDLSAFFGAGGPAPEVAILGHGFDGSVVVSIVDFDTQTTLAEHPVGSPLTPISLEVLPSFGGSLAPDLAVVAHDPSDGSARLLVLDAFSGASLVNMQISPDFYPLGSAVTPDFDGTLSAEVAVATRNPATGAVSVLVVDGGDGSVLRQHPLAAGLVPYDLEALDDLGAFPDADVAVLSRRVADGALVADTIDANFGLPEAQVFFDPALQPGRLRAADVLGTAARELLVSGRKGADVVVEIRDPAAGTLLSSFGATSAGPPPVALDLATLPSFLPGGTPADETLLQYEFLGDPSLLSIFDSQLGAPPALTFPLP